MTKLSYRDTTCRDRGRVGRRDRLWFIKKSELLSLAGEKIKRESSFIFFFLSLS